MLLEILIPGFFLRCISVLSPSDHQGGYETMDVFSSLKRP